MTALTIATALACMLASGALFAFSAFARADPADPGAAARWRDYAGRWTALDHLRVALGAAGAALLAAAAV